MIKLRTILLCLLLALTGAGVEAALFGGGEGKAFDAASNSFRLEMWERAEREFAEFGKEYPKSERLSDAVLLQAQAQFAQRKYREMLELLEPRQAQAGSLADQYLYWIGEAQFKATNYSAAAVTFGKLAREFPTFSKRLEAAVNEAAALAKLGHWTNVVELLRNPGGPFRLAASAAAAGDEMVARGFLLQAEVQFTLQMLPDAEVTLKKITAGLSGELEWRRRFLLGRTLVERG
ncbi:MAG: tetratricopeptide repeat protein, partial [Akkermansiaceae bacterium]|nr:tetratricopeptide repeat protein [Verrucomicrobiales bacterium]